MDRVHVFLDESGECKCSSSSAYKHFAIVAVFVPARHSDRLKGRFKDSVAALVRAGWDRNREVKAYDVYNDRRYGALAVERIITRLAECPGIGVGYVVVRKDGLTSQPLRSAPYGIMYNYFAGVLLQGLVKDAGLRDIHLTYDLRNKESHREKHFDEYLQTLIRGYAFQEGIDITLDVLGMESHTNNGLGAADFFSWAVFRRFERGDSRFMDLFSPAVAFRQEWYVK